MHNFPDNNVFAKPRAEYFRKSGQLVRSRYNLSVLCWGCHYACKRSSETSTSNSRLSILVRSGPGPLNGWLLIMISYKPKVYYMPLGNLHIAMSSPSSLSSTEAQEPSLIGLVQSF